MRDIYGNLTKQLAIQSHSRIEQMFVMNINSLDLKCYLLV